jgi:hypothetical protein
MGCMADHDPSPIGDHVINVATMVGHWTVSYMRCILSYPIDTSIKIPTETEKVE